MARRPKYKIGYSGQGTKPNSSRGKKTFFFSRLLSPRKGSRKNYIYSPMAMPMKKLKIRRKK